MPYLLVTSLRLIAVAFGVLMMSWGASRFFATGDIFWAAVVSFGYLVANVVWYISRLCEERFRYNIVVPFPFKR